MTEISQKEMFVCSLSSLGCTMEKNKGFTSCPFPLDVSPVSSVLVGDSKTLPFLCRSCPPLPIQTLWQTTVNLNEH